MEYVLRKWREGNPGIVPKSRDVGISWLAVGLSCALCLLNEGVVIGFGSRKEEYVDKLDSPKSLFYKARLFLRYLPPEFRNGWNEKTDAPHMRIKFPATSSVMTGEAGDNIGRGDRTAIYWVDESAHLERPQLAEASLSATTTCRIDMSSVNGTGNPFAEKVRSGKIEVFTFHWRDDPRKDDVWYAKQIELLSPQVVAQEIDISFTASVTGVVIPASWVQAAIDAHVKLGWRPTGARRGALDVADEGKDNCALAGGHGPLLEYLGEWSGKGDDIYGTVERTHADCHAQGYTQYTYDADGLGAGVRGDARKVNENDPLGSIEAMPFRGSSNVVNPDANIPTATPGETSDAVERSNEDFFANRKAQGWWELRVKFQRTYRAVTEGHTYPPDQMISLSGRMPLLQKLCMELSQPTYSQNGAGKILIDKAPDGSKSPNLADSVMILYAPAERRARSFFDD